MKNFYILFALITSILTATSQTFVDTTKLWNVAVCSVGPFSVYCETRSYKLLGDTTIGLFTYKKLYVSYDTTLTSWGVLGAMRDSGQKVYYNNFFGEYLLYNFGANVGDTIETFPYPFCLENYLVVDSIDTVIIHGHPKRRLIFNFPSCGYNEEWIEDIGSNHGVINEFIVNGDLVDDFGEDLLCYWQNDTVKWINPIYNDCYYTTVGIEENVNQIFSTVSPNPFSDFATINLHGFKGNWNWKLYNSFGQIVQLVNNIVDSQLTIKNENLTPGVYMYQIYTEKQNIFSGKVTIQ